MGEDHHTRSYTPERPGRIAPGWGLLPCSSPMDGFTGRSRRGEIERREDGHWLLTDRVLQGRGCGVARGLGGGPPFPV